MKRIDTFEQLIGTVGLSAVIEGLRDAAKAAARWPEKPKCCNNWFFEHDNFGGLGGYLPLPSTCADRIPYG